MNENEIIDESLLENIEGLLFSEEYADSEDNSSIISEIADADIPAEEENSNGDGEDASAKGSGKNDSQKANVKENVLNIDFSEDFFENGFGSLAIEKIRDSIRGNRGSKRFFIEKNSIKKDGLITNFPVWTYDDSERSSFDSCMKAGLGIKSLRESVENLKIINAPVVDLEKSVFPVENVSTAGGSRYSVGTSKEVESPSVCTEKSKAPIEKSRPMIAAPIKEPDVSKKTEPFANRKKTKLPAREVLGVEKPNKVETSKDAKFSAISTGPSKASRDSEKTSAMSNFEKPKFVAREVLGVEKPSKAESSKDAKFSAISTESLKASRDSEKTNVMADFEKPKTVAREVLGVEKPNKAETNKDAKFSAINPELSKASRNSEKTSAMPDFDKPKTVAREVLGVEKPSKAESSKDAKFSAISTESLKASRDSEKTNVMADFEKPRFVASEVLGVEKPSKPETGKESKFNSINTEPPKASSINPEKSRDSINSEKVKPAPQKDFAEIKSDYKNIASNSAISITGDRSLNMTSSCSQKQDEMFFDTDNNGKRNAFENGSFNVLRKGIFKYMVQKRTSFFSLTERSLTKKNIDNAFEKKSRISMFSEKRISAYDCMKNDFKRKKELF
ncbi:hypothetical protein [uncultured Fibrobacter sp.]|uniref:hypothetical protein n=1 Tax=uncultured Fibrobacter sp. TaxID=261512 RepID=UPI002618E34D|nr:hypothetical protein [uncultured Fibrobacter sp.]